MYLCAYTVCIICHVCIMRNKSDSVCICECECYLALQKEEHEHADEISVGTAPPSALSQRLFCLWVMTTEQPDRERGGWKRGERGIMSHKIIKKK